jgi:FkbM family methyltransferase
MYRSDFSKKVAKTVIPFTSSCLARLRMHGLVRYAELGASLLQGKGAGSGWDISAEIQAAADCILRPDPILLDVGANNGRWTQGMLRLFPATRKVVLFEPQEECLAAINSLQIPGKVVVPAAVSDHAGTELFHISCAGWGAASLYERNETFFADRPQKKIAVQVTTLDAVLEGEAIDHVDFAKFDIEGAELAAFRGATRTFSRGAIGALSFEFGSGNINSRTFFRDFWDFLTGHGFEMFRVLPGGRTLRISEYYEDLEYFRGVSNYVCKAKKVRNVQGLAVPHSPARALYATH